MDATHDGAKNYWNKDTRTVQALRERFSRTQF